MNELFPARMTRIRSFTVLKQYVRWILPCISFQWGLLRFFWIWSFEVSWWHDINRLDYGAKRFLSVHNFGIKSSAWVLLNIVIFKSKIDPPFCFICRNIFKEYQTKFNTVKLVKHSRFGLVNRMFSWLS